MTLNISSFNARGLADYKKRNIIFKWLYDNHRGIILLQETHSTVKSENEWQKQWKGKIIFNHGDSNSRGVAILIPDYLNIDILDEKTDEDGRILLVNLKYMDTIFVLCNIYAPTKDKKLKQLECLNVLQNILENYQDENFIIGGDFNLCINPNIDKKGGITEDMSEYSEAIQTFMDEKSMIDIWRVLYPDSKRYTWRGKSKHGIVQSRLDMFICSRHLLYMTESAEIKPGIKSDHSIINIKLSVQDLVKKGPGFWKFNSSLLIDEAYIAKINEVIHNCETKYEGIENKALKWDVIKCEIRSETISYASWKAKENRKKEKLLNEKLKTLESIVNDNHTVYEEYKNTQRELDKFHEERARGVVIRSRAQVIEDGSSCSKYFQQIEKRNYKVKNLTTLITDSAVLHNHKDILEEEYKYYTKLYSKTTSENCCEANCTLLTNLPKISTEEQNLCDKNITIEECGLALHEMSNNKTPGTDGLSTEFYKFFWGRIKKIVYESFQYSLEHGNLSQDQKRSILTLLPKDGKDIRYLKNWRPLSILNTDYKILTKLLANRLQKVIGNIVSEDQVGYIKGRQLTQNCRKIIDVFEITASQTDPGIAMFLDFEKAFDTVDHRFMLNTLAGYNFGPVFCKWIEILYNKPLTSVMNNGYTTDSIEITRGIRQGCPISALLFVLVAEVMAIQIRNDKSIKGIQIESSTITISQMADDTTLFLSNLSSVKQSLEILRHFQKCAGLKLNNEKTKAIQLGRNTVAYQDKFGLNWNDEVIKVTGVLVGKDMDKIVRETLETKITRVKNLLSIWKAHNLTIKGKITVIKSRVMPILLYVVATYPIPSEFIDRIDKLFFDFIWPNGKHHVKKKVLISSIDAGGLNMPDFETFAKSIKLSWLNKIVIDKSSYINFASSVTGIVDIEQFMGYKNDINFIKNKMPLFYKQLFQFWFELHSRPPENVNEILNEQLFNNKRIIVDKKPCFFLSWHNSGIRKVVDIIDQNGNFMTKDSIENKYGVEIDIMRYNSIKASLPREWKSKITKDAMSKFNDIMPLEEKLEMKRYNMNNSIKSKMFYRELIERKTKEIANTAALKWEEYFYYYDFNWIEIRKLPYLTTRETELHSFQFQVLNRYIACNDSLFKWEKAETNICRACDQIETIEHMLYDCLEAQQFWKSLTDIWFSCYGVAIRLSVTDILFGLVNCDPIDYIESLNFIILYGKKHIYSNCVKNEKYSIEIFLQEIILRLQVEKYIWTIKDKRQKFDQRWSQFYQFVCRVVEE